MTLLTSHPRLRDCRRLFLREHSALVQICVHDFEKHAPQRLIFNVELYVPLAVSTPRNDRLEEVVDYDFIRSAITERLARGHIELQETLCDDLLAAMLANPRVRAALVSTEKPDVYADCASVGCQVFGLRDEDPA